MPLLLSPDLLFFLTRRWDVLRANEDLLLHPNALSKSEQIFPNWELVKNLRISLSRKNMVLRELALQSELFARTASRRPEFHPQFTAARSYAPDRPYQEG